MVPAAGRPLLGCEGGPIYAQLYSARGTVGAGPRLPGLFLSERLIRTKSGHT
jgi:hypothetical protein